MQEYTALFQRLSREMHVPARGKRGSRANKKRARLLPAVHRYTVFLLKHRHIAQKSPLY